jgi:hypothetical protein
MSILEHLDQLTSAPGEYAVQKFNDTKQLDDWIMFVACRSWLSRQTMTNIDPLGPSHSRVQVLCSIDMSLTDELTTHRCQ